MMGSLSTWNFDVVIVWPQKRKSWQISFPSQFFKDKWNGLREKGQKTVDKKFCGVTDYLRNNILAHYQSGNSRYKIFLFLFSTKKIVNIKL